MNEGRPGTAEAPISDDEQLAAAPAPIGQLSRAVKDDVGRLRTLLRAIRTPYTVFGFTVLLAAASIGVFATLLGGFHDWYMHGAMHTVLLALVLLYFRAALRGRRWRQAGYACVTSAMLVYFAWILNDLVPGRREIAGDRVRIDGVIVPDVVMRPDAPWLDIAALLLLVGAGWLLLHWIVMSRRSPA